MSKFVPLIGRVHKPWQKVGLVLLMLVLMFAWGVVSNKALGAEPASQPTVTSPNILVVPPGGHRQKEHLRKDTRLIRASFHLASHTIRYHVLDKQGNPVPRVMRGHRICPRGWYASFSKYHGMYCENFKEDRHVTKAVIRCGGEVAIGYAFGRMDGVGAGLAMCAWEGLMR